MEEVSKTNPTVMTSTPPVARASPSYDWSDRIQMYAAVDNMFDAPPPNIPTIGGGGTSCITYDCIGRSYRVGVRFNQ